MQEKTKSVIAKVVVVVFVFSIDINFLMGINFIYLFLAAACLSLVLLVKRWGLLHFVTLFTLLGVGNNMVHPLVTCFLFPVLSFAFVLPFPKTREGIFLWFRKGRLDMYSLWLSLLVIVLSTVGLILWGWGNEFPKEVVEPLSSASSYSKLLVMFLGLPVFAFVNAVFEEVVFRGIMQTALIKVFRNRYWAVILQASAFGFAHYAVGFPNGFIGVLMTFMYGLAIGAIKERTNGILWPILVHTLADFVIFNLVFWTMIF
ncbi:MAG: CPBP family intramembrane metalloprotease [Lentisphaerae bacterium]|nr:CPBP family intramembrane metalloprotease [Lentisphaerota bacterium]